MNSSGCLIDKILKSQGTLCRNVSTMSENTSPSLQILKWENAKRNMQVLFPQLLSWEITILLSRKAMLLFKASHKLSDQRQEVWVVVLVFFAFLKWLIDPWHYTPLGIWCDAHTWSLIFFRRCWALPPLPLKPYLGLCKRNRRSVGISSEASMQTAVGRLQLLKV